MARGKKKETILTPEEKLQQALVSESEWPYKVPENWCWTRLSSLISASKEKTEDFSDKEVKYIGLENIEKDYGIVSYNSSEGIKSLKSVFHEGQILYGKLRPYLNKHDIAPFNGVCSTDILVFNAKETTINQFVDYFLNLQSFIEYAVANSKGINLPRVSESVVLDALCPLPPLPEQQRIVDRIESLFAKLDEAKEKAQAVVDGFEDWKAAILHKAFTGELTKLWRKKQGLSYEKWGEKAIGEFAFVTKLAGFEYTKNIAPNLTDSGIPLFKGKNVQKGELVLEFESYIPKEVSDELFRSKLTKKCLLTPYVGTIGNIAIFDGSFEAHLGSNVGKIEINDEMTEEFLLYYLRSDLGYKELTKEKKATAQESISIQAIRNVVVPVPSQREQERIVEILDLLIGKEKQAQDSAEQVIAQIDTMKKSILARAFRGELGTNDPSDESAEELLKRIL